MIVTVKGTSGTGKSTLVRRVMDLYGEQLRFKVAGRKQPIGYVLKRKSGQSGRSLAVVGHYKTDCGGCDTINKVEEIFDLVRKSHASGFDVLFEGLLISADIKRTLALHEDGLPLKVVGLNTPLEQCLESVNLRRHNRWLRQCETAEAKGRKKPRHPGEVKKRNTEAKFKGVKSAMRQLDEAGVSCEWCSREEAFLLIRNAMDV